MLLYCIYEMDLIVLTLTSNILLISRMSEDEMMGGEGEEGEENW